MKLTQDEMHELEILTLLGEKDFDHTTCDNSYIDLVMKSGKKAFKIIKKQQKEIKRLESKNKRVLYFSNNYCCDDYIPKKEIKEKIHELETAKISIEVGYEKIFETKMDNARIIETLKEILGE